MPLSLKTRTPSDRKKILLIGDSGGGKTSLLGRAPKPLYIADFDNGLAPLVGEDIFYDEFFPNPEAPGEAWDAFKKIVQVWRKEPQGATFAWDSFTMGAQSALAWTLNKNGRSVGKIQIGDWGEAIDEVKKQLAYITTLRCNAIVTAHYQMVRDDVLGGIYFTPLVYGKDLPQLIAAYFNDVWRPFVESEAKANQPPVPVYKVQVAPAGKFNTLKNTLRVKDVVLNSEDVMSIAFKKEE